MELHVLGRHAVAHPVCTYCYTLTHARARMYSQISPPTINYTFLRFRTPMVNTGTAFFFI